MYKLTKWVVILFALAATSWASATTPSSKLNVTVHTGNDFLHNINYWGQTGWRHYINFNITGALSASFVDKHGRNVDVYFGVLTQDQNIFSWVPAEITPSAPIHLHTGLKPFIENYAYEESVTTSPGKMGAPYLLLTLDNTIPRGIYTLFAIVLPAGANVSDYSNWEALGSMTLYIYTQP